HRAGLSVHLLGNNAATPTGWSASIQNLELRAAGERFGSERSHVIVWHAGDQAQAAGPEMQYAQVLKGTGFEYLDSLLADTLYRSTAAALATTSAQQELAAVTAAAAGDQRTTFGATTPRRLTPKFLYVECVQQDLAKLQPFRARL